MALDQAIIDAIEESDFTPEMTGKLLEKVGNDRAKGYLTTKGGFIVEDKTTRDKALEKERQLFANSESARMYGIVDRLLSSFGEEYIKPNGTSTSQHIDNLIKAGKLPSLEAQMSKVEEKLKEQKKDGGEPDAKLQAAFDGIKKQLEDKETADKQLEQTRTEKAIGRDIKSSLKTAKVPVEPGLKADSKEYKDAVADGFDTINTIFNSKYGGKIEEDGSITYYPRLADGKLDETKPLVNESAEALTPIEIIQKNHAKLLAPNGHQQSGGGTGGQGGGGQGGGSDKKTMESILMDAAKLNLKTNSVEWKEFIKEEKKKAGITN